MAIEIRIEQLRPNNWFLNETKLERVRAAWRDGRADELPPVVVSLIDGEWSLIDGHSRVFVAWENGQNRVWAVVEEMRDLTPSRIYRDLHEKGREAGVRSIADLAPRVLNAEEYEAKWLGFCSSLG